MKNDKRIARIMAIIGALLMVFGLLAIPYVGGTSIDDVIGSATMPTFYATIADYPLGIYPSIDMYYRYFDDEATSVYVLKPYEDTTYQEPIFSTDPMVPATTIDELLLDDYKDFVIMYSDINGDGLTDMYFNIFVSTLYSDILVNGNALNGYTEGADSIVLSQPTEIKIDGVLLPSSGTRYDYVIHVIVLNPQTVKEVGYNQGYSTGESVGYQNGFAEGILDSTAYNDGYNIGYEEAAQRDFAKDIFGDLWGNITGALNDFRLFKFNDINGNEVWVTLGLVFAAGIGLALFVWILKMFAGG